MGIRILCPQRFSRHFRHSHTIAKSAIGLAPGDNHSSAGSQYFVLEMLPQIRDLLGGKASLWNYVEHLRVLIYDERVLVFDEPTEI